MLLAILDFIADSDDPHALVARLMQAVPSGSYLVISPASSDIMAERVAASTDTYNSTRPRRSLDAPSSRSPGSSTGWNWSRRG